jgi:hypothetical protein
MKNSVFWEITQCSLIKVNRRYGGEYLLHLQCRRVSQERTKHEAGNKNLEENCNWYDQK